MKTHKEEAEEIFKMFSDVIPIETSFNDTSDEANRKFLQDHEATKQCSIIYVNGIIEETRHYQDLVSVWQKERDYTVIERIKHWKQVLNHLKQM